MSFRAFFKNVSIWVAIYDTVVIGVVLFEVDTIDTPVVIFIGVIVNVIVVAILNKAESTDCIQL
jgi:hypothetical protein